MRLIDLSHVITDRMVTYPGLPGPEIGLHISFEQSQASYASGTEFSIGRITMIANTGTYLDTPAHRHRGGWDLSGLPLQRCALLPALVVHTRATGAESSAAAGSAVDLDQVEGVDVRGYAVLFHTGWDRHWGTRQYGSAEHPYLSEQATRYLIDGGAVLVGIDSVNIDDTRTGARPVHTALLAADIPIVEHLTGLEALPHRGARFTAVPVAVAGMATFPVRAFATLPDDEDSTADTGAL